MLLYEAYGKNVISLQEKYKLKLPIKAKYVLRFMSMSTIDFKIGINDLDRTKTIEMANNERFWSTQKMYGLLLTVANGKNYSTEIICDW